MTGAKNPPAFPVAFARGGHDGMSLRDYLAGQALAGLISKADPEDDPAEIAAVLYRLADAMLAERSKA